MDNENLALLKEETTLIGLKASAATLLARVGNGSKRPLLKGPDRRKRLEELMHQREGRYAEAHFIVNTDHLTLVQVVDRIIDRLGRQDELHANLDR
jgi:shikimate kinase